MLTVIISIYLFCGLNTQKSDISQRFHPYFADTVRTIQQAETNKNKEAVIYGRLQKFTPWTEGKGANHMFWDWEIEFAGGGRIPIVSKNKTDKLNPGEFENRNVIVTGLIFFGTVIGDENPGHQSASGYRIDAVSITADNHETGFGLDTLRMWKDIEAHWNQNAFVEGKIKVYEPPHDSSKLGDEMIWQWVLVTADNYSVPVTAKNSSLEISRYVGKSVLVKAFIKYGIIFGRENTANIVGARIDAEEIYELNAFAKIHFAIGEFNDEGLRERPVGEFSPINYEFCIPASDSVLNEVRSIDPTVNVYKTSKGRSGCTDKEWLCIGYSRQPGFKDVIFRLASLSYIRQISETFWE